jgi:hypothetical protein
MAHPSNRLANQLRRLGLPVTAVMLCFAVGIHGDSRSPSPGLDGEAPSIIWSQTVPLPLLDPCVSVVGSVESRGVAVGPDRDVVAVGIRASLSTIVVVKFDGVSGDRLWCTAFPIRATTATGSMFLVGSAEVGGVAIDSNGTIFIGGHGATAPLSPQHAKPGPPPTQPAVRYFATKCSSIGICASAVTFINPPFADAHNATIGGIAVGPDGQPVLTGLAEFAASKNKVAFRLLTVKVHGSTLAPLATAQASSNAPGTGSAQDVAVDSSNNIFVTGTEASTVKYDALLSKTPMWTASLAGSRITTAPHQEGVDDPGAVDEVAVLRAGVKAGFAITKLNRETGATLWTNVYDSRDIDIPTDLAFDDVGNIVVSGNRGGTGGLVSLGATGEIEWADSVPSSFFSGVAAGLDGAPVASGYGEAPGGRTRVMITLSYDSSDFELPQISSGGRSDHGQGPRQNTLAWDQAISETVTGFLVCIDGNAGTQCQDVGSPANLTRRILPSTTPGSLTYEIALSTLTSVGSGKRKISVIAYTNEGRSPASPPLSVAGRFGQHTFK